MADTEPTGKAMTLDGIAKMIQECLAKAGIDAEVTRLSHHKVLVHKQQVEVQGKQAKIAAFVTTREVMPTNAKAVTSAISQARHAIVSQKPSLGARSAAAFGRAVTGAAFETAAPTERQDGG